MRWRLSRTSKLVALSASAALLLVSVASASQARKLFDPVYRVGARHVTLYLCVAIAVLFVPFVVRGRGVRIAHVASGLTALIALSVVGPGLAKEDNRLNSFPTRVRGERELAARAQRDPLGDMSLWWPTMTAVAPLVKGHVTMTDDQFPAYAWRPALEGVAQLPIRIDRDYEPTLAPSDPRLQGEWLFDRHLTPELHLVVIGRGENYRVYESDNKVVLLAEEG